MTAPTAVVETYAGIVSTEVSIFRPSVPLAVAVTAALAARVKPEHVRVTVPAAAEAEVVTVIAFEANAAVDAVVGAVNWQKVEPLVTAVMSPDGNPRVIFPPLGISEEVVNVTVAVPVAATALDKVKP